MLIHTNHQNFMIAFRRSTTVLSAVLMLSLLAGCDPCMNNPCDDGVTCNGFESCTADGGVFVCIDGTPVTCEQGTMCTEPDGTCVADETPDPCAMITCDTSDPCNPEVCADGVCMVSPVVCNTSDMCNPEVCVEGSCVGTPVDCPEGQTCDPATGMCSEAAPTTITKLSEVTGVYSGVGICGDDDDQVTFFSLGGVFTMSGFTGNDDIALTFEDDLNATADSVTAFGTAGHALRLTLDPKVGYINTTLIRDGAFCETDLMLVKQ